MKVPDFLARIYRRVHELFIPTPRNHLREELTSSFTVLDLGCGKKSPIQFCEVRRSIGVDLFSSSLRESKRKGIHSEYVRADITYLPFKDKSFDALVCFDMIEHLSKIQGYCLMVIMEKLAKQKIIIFTPNGYLPQNTYENNTWQRHRSGWSQEEFEKLGFTICGMNGLRVIRGDKASIRYKPKFLWRLISDFSELIVHHNPSYAFQLFCVKTPNWSLS